MQATQSRKQPDLRFRLVFVLVISIFALLLSAAFALLSRANNDYMNLAVERQAGLATSAVQNWFNEHWRNTGGVGDSRPDADLPETAGQVSGITLFNEEGVVIFGWGSLKDRIGPALAGAQDMRRLAFGDRVIHQQDGNHVLYIRQSSLRPRFRNVMRMMREHFPPISGQERPIAGPGFQHELPPPPDGPPPNPVLRPPAFLLVVDFDGSAIHAEGGLRQAALLGLTLGAGILLAGLAWLFIRIQRLQASLEHQQSLARLGSAARTLAHEIRNPLSIIIMQKSILQKQMDPKFHDGLELIGTEANRIQRLMIEVKRMLGQETRNQPMEAAGELSNWLETLVASIPAWKDMIQLIPAPAHHAQKLVANIDTDSLRSIVVNLVQNALEAGADKVEIGWWHEHGRIHIRVDDQAGGIPRSIRNRMFDPFFTTKPDGSGVGLSLSRQIARSCNGDLKCKPLPPKGTRFLLTLPELTGGNNG